MSGGGAAAEATSRGRDVAGRDVLVAGASRGIGAAVAVALARDGARRVALAGRSRADLERVADEVRAAGAEPAVVVADLTTAAGRGAAVAAAGRLDVLVHNAGTNRPGPFAEVTEETYDALFALNVRSAFFLARDAAAAMRSRGDDAGAGGVLVFLSSQMGHVGAVDRSVYCATKHAVEGLVKALAVELAPEGIRAVSVAPTFVRTAMTAAQLDDPVVGDRLLAGIPLGRWATTDDVAAAVAWVASPAAAMITGTSIRVDGGWTAR